jgi:spore maturation protein SpmA
MDLTAQSAPVASEIIKNMLLRVTHGFDNAISCCGLKTSMKIESLSPQKSSTKMLQRVTYGFDSANSPCGLKNHHQNCFHG